MLIGLPYFAKGQKSLRADLPAARSRGPRPRTYCSTQPRQN